MENTKDFNELVTGLAPNGSIQRACEIFEAELKRGSRPAIERYVANWDEPERSKLMCELLRLEIRYADLLGKFCTKEEYQARFPDHREVVDEAFLATIAPACSEEILFLSAALHRRGLLGQGGLGIVYLAEDKQLQRDIAVKFIQDNLKNNPQSQEQFQVEAEITSRLEHPGIVPVHGMGRTPDGRPFYVMQLIRGERFDETIASYYQQIDQPSQGSVDRHVGLRELLAHFVAACKTVAYAHNRGVVHRDIKPANIMLGRYGETLVIDWGLAAHVGRQGIFKNSSEKTLMPGASGGSSQKSGGGTPPYMSPEQAAGREFGPLSDIYSLGATLYTVLTGQVPFLGSQPEVLDKVIRGAFSRPTEVRSGVSKALDAICLKAMSLDPQRRYPTALALAEDVERFLADAPVSAYQEPPARRLARWARRHRTTAQTALLGLLLVAVTASGGALWLGRKAALERQLHVQTETARRTEETLRRSGLQMSALFAARTIANQIDLRWRILEKEAADPELRAALTQVNADTQNGEHYAPVQQWLDARVEQEYAELPYRTWFIQAMDGTQIARVPSHENGERASSLGGNFAYRNYFHGRKQDYSRNEGVQTRPLQQPHNSTAFRSTVDSDLTVVLSVPIGASDGGSTIGVMAMSIELGHFADLQADLPEGQDVLLVESRKYFMLDDNGEPEGQLGEGLVLHHKDLAKFTATASLPNVSQSILKHMRGATSRRNSEGEQSGSRDNLLPADYRDPLRKEPCLAAFAPVIVATRPASQQDTGWFVIVQQKEQDSELPLQHGF